MLLRLDLRNGFCAGAAGAGDRLEVDLVGGESVLDDAIVEADELPDRNPEALRDQFQRVEGRVRISLENGVVGALRDADRLEELPLIGIVRRELPEADAEDRRKGLVESLSAIQTWGHAGSS